MTLDEEILFYENKDTVEIFNMFCEKQYIYANNNKIEAGKKFSKYLVGYHERRYTVGMKRLALYDKRILRDRNDSDTMSNRKTNNRTRRSSRTGSS